MQQIVALLVGAVAGYLPHLLLEGRVTFWVDYLVSSVIAAAAYVYTVYKLKKLRGDF